MGVMSGKVIPFAPVSQQSFVDGSRIKESVYGAIDFELPEHIYRVVDELLADFWNSIPCGCWVCTEDFEQELDKLYRFGILLGQHQRRQLAESVFEALESSGHLKK